MISTKLVQLNNWEHLLNIEIYFIASQFLLNLNEMSKKTLKQQHLYIISQRLLN